LSVHRELELLVRAGLTPEAALAAAASVPARIYNLRDRGRIAPGLRADLVLVAGDPTHDIRPPRYRAIWKRGARVERPKAAMMKFVSACVSVSTDETALHTSPHLFDRIAVLPRWSLVENHRVLCILKRGQKRV
jgi:adenine deaminase